MKGKIEKLKIRFLEDSLLIKDILIISDLHLGRDDFFEQSVFEKLEKLFDFLDKNKIKIKKIIILGDLKHQFGNISESEWRGVLKLLDFLIKKIDNNKNIIVLKGNHDAVLEPILNKRGIKLKDYYKIKGICFLHGDKFYKKCEDSKIIITGHLHPTITLSDKYKRERYRCFLKGIWKNKEVYIIPSFTPLSRGYNLNNLDEVDFEEGFGIFNDKNLRKFDVIIYNNKDCKEYNFGKLKKFIY